MTQVDRKSRARDEIDQNLKRAFDRIEQEAIPDRFANLLDQLRAQTSGENTGDSSEGSGKDER